MGIERKSLLCLCPPFCCGPPRGGGRFLFFEKTYEVLPRGVQAGANVLLQPSRRLYASALAERSVEHRQGELLVFHLLASQRRH